MRRLIIPALTAAIFAAPAAAQTQSAEAEILAVVNGVFEAMRRADSAMARPLFHAKARLITMDLRAPGRPAQIEESVEGLIRSFGQQRPEVFDEQLSNVRVTIDGSLASVWADYRFFRGTTLNHCGIDHFLLVNEGQGWKIVELADTRRRC